jgi:hypothetical protein
MEIESTPTLLVLRRAGGGRHNSAAGRLPRTPARLLWRVDRVFGLIHTLRCLTESERTIPLLPAGGQT